MIVLQLLAVLGSANDIDITQKSIPGQCMNLEFVRATTNIDDHGTVHLAGNQLHLINNIWRFFLFCHRSESASPLLIGKKKTESNG